MEPIIDSLEVRHLEPTDLGLIAEIDRSELIERQYVAVDGDLSWRPVNWDIPTFDPQGAGEHSVQEQVDHWRPLVDRGAVLLGAYSGEQFLGLAIVEVAFEPDLAWLAFLHVTRPARRMGVGARLWSEAVRLATAFGSSAMYVSAMPSGSAVGFYLSRGCRPTETPHPDLFADEPEDIHLVCPLPS